MTPPFAANSSNPADVSSTALVIDGTKVLNSMLPITSTDAISFCQHLVVVVVMVVAVVVVEEEEEVILLLAFCTVIDRR